MAQSKSKKKPTKKQVLDLARSMTAGLPSVTNSPFRGNSPLTPGKGKSLTPKRVPKRGRRKRGK